MRKGNTSGVVRRNRTLPAEFVARMAELRELTGIQSDSELIRRSLNLLGKVVENGDSVVVENSKTKEKTRLTFL